MANTGGSNDALLAVRVKETDLIAFKKKCTVLGKPYHIMIREIICAFNLDRMCIILTDEQKEAMVKEQKETFKLYKSNI